MPSSVNIWWIQMRQAWVGQIDYYHDNVNDNDDNDDENENNDDNYNADYDMIRMTHRPELVEPRPTEAPCTHPPSKVWIQSFFLIFLL